MNQTKEQSEFYGFEEMFIIGWIKWVHLALIPFLLGLLFIAYFHLILKKRS